MEMALYQVLSPLLAIIMVCRLISQFRRREVRIVNFTMQLAFWGIITAVSLNPYFFVRGFEKLTGFKSGITGMMFLGILILGLLVFHLLQENEKRMSEITKLVRLMAMKDEKKNQEK